MIIDESVLLRSISIATVMARQLHQMRALATNSPVTLQVAELRAARQLISPPLTVLSFADPADAGAACWHGPAGQIHLTRREADVSAL